MRRKSITRSWRLRRIWGNQKRKEILRQSRRWKLPKSKHRMPLHKIIVRSLRENVSKKREFSMKLTKRKLETKKLWLENWENKPSTKQMVLLTESKLLTIMSSKWQNKKLKRWEKKLWQWSIGITKESKRQRRWRSEKLPTMPIKQQLTTTREGRRKMLLPSISDSWAKTRMKSIAGMSKTLLFLKTWNWQRDLWEKNEKDRKN